MKLGASGFILSVVRHGYKIPFVTLPSPKVSPNDLSAVTHSHFVSEAISDLLTLFRLGGGAFRTPLRQNRDNSYTERAMTFKFSDFS